MSDIKKQVAALESQVAALKIRVFDASEIANSHKADADNLSSLVKDIVGLIGVETKDDQVTFEQIIARVKELVEAKSPENEV